MSQDLEAEFGPIAELLVGEVVQMMAHRLEAVFRALETFDRDELRAHFMGVFAEHRQRYPKNEEG